MHHHNPKDDSDHEDSCEVHVSDSDDENKADPKEGHKFDPKKNVRDSDENGKKDQVAKKKVCNFGIL